MAEPSTPAPDSQPLLTTLLLLLQPFRATCQQDRPFQRLSALALAAALNYGRQTLTQMLAILGVCGDWSAFYRLFNLPRLHAGELAHQVATAVLGIIPETGPCVAVVDGVQIPRSSWRFPGSSWLHAPQTPVFGRGIHRAQRWVHAAVLLPRSGVGYSRAVPVRIDPAVPERGHRPAGMAARKEWEVGLEQLHWLREELDTAGRAGQPLLAVADSAWQGAGVWTGLPERTSLLSGCRANRALYALPARTNGPGRPRQYGDRAPRPDAWVQVRAGWQRVELLVRGRTIPVSYRVEGPYVVQGAPDQPLFLLVVRGSQSGHGKKQRRARFWLVSAVDRDGRWTLPYPGEELLSWSWQRWEIEVTHRELKTGFGLGQGQSWGVVSAFLSVQWLVAVYSLLLIAGYRVWGLSPGPARPPGTWWRGSGRWSLDQLRQALRQEVGVDLEYRPLWPLTTGNWWEIADWVSLRGNATVTAGRL